MATIAGEVLMSVLVSLDVGTSKLCALALDLESLRPESAEYVCTTEFLILNPTWDFPMIFTRVEN